MLYQEVFLVLLCKSVVGLLANTQKCRFYPQILFVSTILFFLCFGLPHSVSVSPGLEGFESLAQSVSWDIDWCGATYCILVTLPPVLHLVRRAPALTTSLWK